MTQTSSTVLVFVSWMLLCSDPLRGQESADRTAELLARRKAAIEKPVFQSLPWHLDFADAKQRAEASGKPIFAYFTRSYSP